jgi:hypothetical protein
MVDTDAQRMNVSSVALSLTPRRALHIHTAFTWKRCSRWIATCDTTLKGARSFSIWTWDKKGERSRPSGRIAACVAMKLRAGSREIEVTATEVWLPGERSICGLVGWPWPWPWPCVVRAWVREDIEYIKEGQALSLSLSLSAISKQTCRSFQGPCTHGDLSAR